MTRRTLLAVAAVLLVTEAVIARSYLDRGASWHLLLHSSIGLGLGLAAGGGWAAIRGRPVRALPVAVAGQGLSIAPDLIFVLLWQPHRFWMDVFVGHISVHTAPGPLTVGVAVFLLGGWAWWLASSGRRRSGAVTAASTVGLLAGALVLAEPVPTRLADYPPPTSPAAGGALWWCS